MALLPTSLHGVTPERQTRETTPFDNERALVGYLNTG
jgi:hypothetical protein